MERFKRKIQGPSNPSSCLLCGTSYWSCLLYTSRVVVYNRKGHNVAGAEFDNTVNASDKPFSYQGVQVVPVTTIDAVSYTHLGWGEGALRRKVVLVGKFSETFAYVNLRR